MLDYWPLFALLIVCGFAAVVLMLRDWRVGVLTLAIALPFEGLLPQFGAGSMKLLTAAAVLGLAIHLLNDPALRARATANLRTGMSWALLALVGLSALSMLWATSPGAAAARTLTFAGLFLLLHLFALLDERFLRMVWTVLLFSAALTVPIALLVDGSAAFSEEGRFAAGGLNPNDYAGLLVVILLGGIGITLGGAWLRALCGAVLLLAIFLTGSRTAFVALAAAPLLFVLVSPPGTRKAALLRGTAAYVAIVLAVGAAALVNRPQVEAVQARAVTLKHYASDTTWAGRLDIWRGGIEMFREAPVLGIGAGNFAIVSPTVSGMPRRPSAAGPGPVAHNVFLGLAAELGTIGLGIFLWFLIAAVVSARAVASAGGPKAGAMLLGLTACVLIGLSLSWEYTKIVYIVAGSVLALASGPVRGARRLAAP
jgi:putative inorganic carbon (HCO3(-)) transporter